jgi:hypothetical protein
MISVIMYDTYIIVYVNLTYMVLPIFFNSSIFKLTPIVLFTLLLRRDSTEDSSTRPRFPTHHVLNVSLQIANKLRNLKKKMYF